MRIYLREVRKEKGLSINRLLRDEFGFGKDRLKRFAERFEKKTDCLVDEFVNWEDIIENIKEETGLEESIRKNEVK